MRYNNNSEEVLCQSKNLKMPTLLGPARVLLLNKHANECENEYVKMQKGLREGQI